MRLQGTPKTVALRLVVGQERISKMKYLIEYVIFSLALVLSISAYASSNNLHKLLLTAFVDPGGALISDKRFVPTRNYSLEIGETTNGITVIEIDRHSGKVLVSLDGYTNWFPQIDQERTIEVHEQNAK